MVEAYEKTYNDSHAAHFQLELDQHFSTPLLGFVANPQNSKLIAYDHGLSIVVQNIVSKD